MKKTNAIIAVAAAVVLLPGLLAACSGTPSSDSTDRVSSRGGSGSGSSVTSCLRDKGYDVPEPSSSTYRGTLAPPDGVDEDQWDADLQACIGDGREAGDGFQAAKPLGSVEQLKKLSKCIRDSGFSDYPDDQAGQRTYQAKDQDAFQEASSKCLDEVIGSEGVEGTTK